MIVGAVADGVKGTKVLAVHGGNLSFVPGRQWKFRRQTATIGVVAKDSRGGIVKRNALMLGIATLACATVLVAQTAKKTSTGTAKDSGSAAAARGKDIFQQKCSICHYADSDAKKIGPGLKGLSKRGTFTVSNKKVTDENLKTWIENGDTLMPAMKDILDAAQIKDVIAYVKTL